jgi:hypothetical protein
LSPRDFILFGSGLGDEDADMNPVRESKVSWISGRGEFRENYVLIPASSVKGAISHRVAYYWNKLNNCYAEDNNATVGAQNEAVRILFGYEDQEKKEQKRGNVLFSDVFVSPDSVKSKVLHHVSIDRYTGGAKAGALFQEKVNYMGDNRLQLDLLVKANLFRENDKLGLLRKSLESALKDVCEGLLPLGGGVNRGQGSFYGEMTCDGELV